MVPSILRGLSLKIWGWLLQSLGDSTFCKHQLVSPESVNTLLSYLSPPSQSPIIGWSLSKRPPLQLRLLCSKWVSCKRPLNRAPTLAGTNWHHFWLPWTVLSKDRLLCLNTALQQQSLVQQQQSGNLLCAAAGVWAVWLFSEVGGRQQRAQIVLTSYCKNHNIRSIFRQEQK